MKWKLDGKLIKYCLYIGITVLLVHGILSIFDNVPGIWKNLQSYVRFTANLVKPLLVGIIIAYLLWPLLSLFERLFRHFKLFRFLSKRPRLLRGLCVMLTYALVLGVCAGLIIGIYLMVGGQLSDSTTLTKIIEFINSQIGNTTIDSSYIDQKLEDWNIPFLSSFVQDNLSKIIEFMQKILMISVDSVVNFVFKLGSNLFMVFIALILSIYLLIDKEFFTKLLSRTYFIIFRESRAGKLMKSAFLIFDETFTQFLKGQLLEACFVAILSIIVLFIIGIRNPITIGLIAGITNMIPYVGPWIGTILAVVIAFLGGDYMKVIWVIIGFQIVQQIDNNLLAPKVVGGRVGLHPVFTMTAILVGGSVGGLLGMLIAVPIVASIKNIIVIWYNQSGLEGRRLDAAGSERDFASLLRHRAAMKGDTPPRETFPWKIWSAAKNDSAPPDDEDDISPPPSA